MLVWRMQARFLRYDTCFRMLGGFEHNYFHHFQMFQTFAPSKKSRDYYKVEAVEQFKLIFSCNLIGNLLKLNKFGGDLPLEPPVLHRDVDLILD